MSTGCPRFVRDVHVTSNVELRNNVRFLLNVELRNYVITHNLPYVKKINCLKSVHTINDRAAQPAVIIMTMCHS